MDKEKIQQIARVLDKMHKNDIKKVADFLHEYCIDEGIHPISTEGIKLNEILSEGLESWASQNLHATGRYYDIYEIVGFPGQYRIRIDGPSIGQGGRVLYHCDDSYRPGLKSIGERWVETALYPGA